MTLKFIPKSGDAFVSLADPFSRIKPYRAFLNKEDNDRLYAFHYRPAEEGREPEFVKEPIDAIKEPLFPTFFFRKDIQGLEEEYKLYTAVSAEIESLLLAEKNHTRLLSDVVTFLTKERNFQLEDAKTIIKVLLAEPVLYSYKSIQSGEYIQFSRLKTSSENNRRYYGSIADEIKVQSDRISLLVSHGQTVGNYREHLLRSLLRKYIPEKFKVATGFIENIAKQIDIIVYDGLNFSPVFIEGDLVVVRPESVRAIIEVKTTLDSTTLYGALDTIYEICRPGNLQTGNSGV